VSALPPRPPLLSSYRIVLLLEEGWSGRRIAKALGCAAATVSRTLERWEVYGQAGLVDRREDTGQTKADDWYRWWCATEQFGETFEPIALLMPIRRLLR
jgi:hypothetical protein